MTFVVLNTSALYQSAFDLKNFSEEMCEIKDAATVGVVPPTNDTVRRSWWRAAFTSTWYSATHRISQISKILDLYAP
ncbi:hypothetical protein MLPM_2244 [Mycobacterium lepromatosis]|uniref:Uncharacterized protein n=1 Tax=Mycobacterium lepromatosis TaxID=480418 RepID=A0A0F4EPG0_9MYCO|nr:hypothetical protein MLPM_2244 [Mycobacterium lepromatosis]